MCPACISSAVLYFAGGGSIGGVAAWVGKKWRTRIRDERDGRDA